MSRKRTSTKFYEGLICFGFIGSLALFLLSQLLKIIMSHPIMCLIVAIGVVAMAIYIIREFIKGKVISSTDLSEIDKLDPNAFEHWGEWFFKQLGYHCKVTQYTGDGGIDIKGFDNNGVEFIAQLKHRHPDKVTTKYGYGAIMELIQAETHFYGKKKVRKIVLTNGFFRPQANRVSIEQGVELWDRDRIKKELYTIKSSRKLVGLSEH